MLSNLIGRPWASNLGRIRKYLLESVEGLSVEDLDVVVSSADSADASQNNTGKKVPNCGRAGSLSDNRIFGRSISKIICSIGGVRTILSIRTNGSPSRSAILPHLYRFLSNDSVGTNASFGMCIR